MRHAFLSIATLAVLLPIPGRAQMSLSTSPTSGVPSLSLGSTGNVGVGTQAPDTLLDVRGQADFGAVGTKSTFTALGNLQLAGNSPAQISGSGSLLISTASTTGSTGIFLSTSGRVGIATAQAAATFHVKKGWDGGGGAGMQVLADASGDSTNGYAGVVVQAYSSSFAPALEFAWGGTSDVLNVQPESSSRDLLIEKYVTSVGWFEQMRIRNSDGHVGISTTAPTDLLSVAGNLNLTGSVKINSGVAFSAIPVFHAGATLSSTSLAAGTTFWAFTPDNSIILRRITATIQTAGAGGSAGTTWYCGTGDGGSQLSVTTSAGATAGTITSSTGSASISGGTNVKGRIESDETTKPTGTVICEYDMQ